MREARPIACGWDLAFARLVLAGIFTFAGVMKLADPHLFATAIKKFEIIQPLADVLGVHAEPILEWLAFIIPGVEIVCGVALVIGLWGRAAALVLFTMLAAFAAGMISVIARGMKIECGCFGEFFGAEVGWSSVVRNLVFMAVAAPVMVRGSGMLSLDALVSNRRATSHTRTDDLAT